MKYLSWISLVIGAIVVINEIAYIGETSLVLVIIGLAASVILLSISQIICKKSE